MRKKRKPHHEEHIDESWLIPYADLLTLLLALFIILFAASQVDSQKYDQIMRSLNSAFTGGSGFFNPASSIPSMADPGTEAFRNQKDHASPQELQAQKETAELNELKDEMDAYIEANQLSAQLETSLTGEMLIITIRDHALFASGSATLTADARRLAAAISDMLTQYPGYHVEVAGHTDNVPIRTSEFESNWELSAKRAINFLRVLLQNDQIEKERFRAIGYAEFQPIDTNATSEGRSKNRRVEVSILRTVKADASL